MRDSSSDQMFISLLLLLVAVLFFALWELGASGVALALAVVYGVCAAVAWVKWANGVNQ